jgi:hypothetical protein
VRRAVRVASFCGRPRAGFKIARRYARWNAALKINPLRQTARHQRSAVLWHLGFLEAATADAEELQMASPAPVLPLLHLGQVAVQRGDFQQAIDYSERVFSSVLPV